MNRFFKLLILATLTPMVCMTTHANQSDSEVTLHYEAKVAHSTVDSDVTHEVAYEIAFNTFFLALPPLGTVVWPTRILYNGYRVYNFLKQHSVTEEPTLKSK